MEEQSVKKFECSGLLVKRRKDQTLAWISRLCGGGVLYILAYLDRGFGVR